MTGHFKTAAVWQPLQMLPRFFGRVVASALTLCVRAYQVVVSPHIGNCCRFEPSCSAYCIEALRTHGLVRGLWLTVKRLWRCRPLGPFGHDPVPPRK